MLDIRMIRENPEKVNELLKRRNPELSIDGILEIDAKRRKVQTQADELRAKRKTISQEIGMLKKQGQNTDEIQAQVKTMGDEIKSLVEQEQQLDLEQRNLLLSTPNIPDETTPVGLSEDDNVEVKKWGEPRKVNFEQKAHWDICVEKDIVDFERGVKLSQSRFSLYRGKGAQLERAIINFFLDTHTMEHGYEEIMPPVMVNAAAMTGTGQLPKFAQDMYKCEEEDLYLIPTAEVPVTNIYANEILSEEDLPKYMTAYTPCFRREAGSAGKNLTTSRPFSNACSISLALAQPGVITIPFSTQYFTILGLRPGLTINLAPAATARSTCSVVRMVPAPTNISGNFSLIMRIHSSAASVLNVTSAQGSPPSQSAFAKGSASLASSNTTTGMIPVFLICSNTGFIGYHFSFI